ncbi:MAG: methionyl-tRNA formyltransferase [Patescibacteria group bacterium]
METKKKIIFWGTPAFAVPSLDALLELEIVSAVVTRPDRRQGRGRRVSLTTPVADRAREHGVSVLQPEKFDDEFVAQLRSYLPATFCTVAYGRLIPEDLLGLSELPALNLHPSLLPRWRGPSPIQYVLLHGETQTGLTLMVMDAEMDHGPIIAQKKIAVSLGDTYVSLSEKLSFSARQFISKHVPLYLSRSAETTIQDHSKATYSKLIKAADAELAVSLAAGEALNRIRALNPWPGTYVTWKGDRLGIQNACATSEVSSDGRRFFKLTDDSLGISFSDGAIQATTVQLSGKRPAHSRDFLHGHPGILRSDV